MDDAVVLGGVAAPNAHDAVRPRVRLELVEVFVEMRERMLLDGRGERAQLLPFGDAVHLAVALLPQIPQPLVVHLLVLGRGDEARRRLGLIDRAIAVDLGAARLLFGPDAQRLRRTLGVIKTLAIGAWTPRHGRRALRSSRMQVGIAAHALAPLRIWAIWMNLIGTPMRSAQPCWCIRHDVSADTIYSAPAWA